MNQEYLEKLYEIYGDTSLRNANINSVEELKKYIEAQIISNLQYDFDIDVDIEELLGGEKYQLVIVDTETDNISTYRYYTLEEAFEEGYELYKDKYLSYQELGCLIPGEQLLEKEVFRDVLWEDNLIVQCEYGHTIFQLESL